MNHPNDRPPRPTIYIQKSRLRTQLDEAAAIKREMTQMLRELEQTATGQPVTKPGAWRHHPLDYLGRVRPAPDKTETT